MEEHKYSVSGKLFSINPETLVVGSAELGSSMDANNVYQEVSHFANDIDNINAISLNVVQRCNFNCSYCYADQGTYGKKGSMCLATARNSIDWLVEHSGHNRELSITFFGGEPLMEFDTIRETVAYAKRKQVGQKFKFNYSVTTNGSLLSDEIVDFLKSHEFWVNVSMDGPVELQDSQRPLLNGKSSAHLVHPKVKKLIGSYTRVSCRATITSEDNRARVTRFLEDFGFTNITVVCASDPLSRLAPTRHVSGPVATEVTDRHTDQDTLDDFLGLIKRRDTSTLKARKLPSHLYKHVHALVTKQKKNAFCGAGMNYVGVSSEGGVYLCHRFIGHEKFKLGEVDQRQELKTLETLRGEFDAVKEASKCASCFARNLCGGGCYHHNLGETGSPFEQSEAECIKIRKSVELAGSFVASLDEQDKHYLLAQNVIATKFCPLDL